ncbi:glycosyltransferase [Rhodobacteraceae bacterium]|nr:glycosyltransferase [Paracoccaceae bacterium]
MRVIHVINSLETGGAERYLIRLANELQALGYSQLIVSLKYEVPLEDQLHDRIRIIKPKNDTIQSFLSMMLDLSRELDSAEDHVVCWMYKSHLVGVLIKLFKNSIKQTWLVRHSNISFRVNKIKSIISVLLSGLFSFIIPRKIIFNSRAGIQSHRKIYCSSKITFRPNFIEFPEITTHYKYDPKLLIMVCRYDAHKNIPFALQIFSHLKKVDKDYSLKLVGRGMDLQNNDLQKLISLHDLQNDIELLGECSDPWGQLHQTGILLSTSLGEGFPNSVAEGVVRGYPVVATNVGETKDIVNDFGSVLVGFELAEFLKAVQTVTKWTREEYWQKYTSTLATLYDRYDKNSVALSFLEDIS